MLGFASGPVCLGSCGPVLLPWLAAERAGLRGTARVLSIFLGGRLVGYIGFAVLAWAVGMALPADQHSRTLIFGVANLGLAVVLVLHVWLPRRRRPEQKLYQIGAKPLFLGLFTGLSLCPPFVAAGVRAAESSKPGRFHPLLPALLPRHVGLVCAGTRGQRPAPDGTRSHRGSYDDVGAGPVLCILGCNRPLLELAACLTGAESDGLSC